MEVGANRSTVGVEWKLITGTFSIKSTELGDWEMIIEVKGLHSIKTLAKLSWAAAASVRASAPQMGERKEFPEKTIIR